VHLVADQTGAGNTATKDCEQLMVTAIGAADFTQFAAEFGRTYITYELARIETNLVEIDFDPFLR
jgi:hypothetical protein